MSLNQLTLRQSVSIVTQVEGVALVYNDVYKDSINKDRNKKTSKYWENSGKQTIRRPHEVQLEMFGWLKKVPYINHRTRKTVKKNLAEVVAFRFS